MLKEAIDIVLETREYKKNNKEINQNTPLKTPKYWQLCHLDYNDNNNHHNKSIIKRIDKIVNDIDNYLQ